MATIDERLEALAQTVELLAKMQIETEKAMTETQKAIKAGAEAHAETEKTVRKLGRFAMIIGTDRESRISGLEAGRDEAS